MIKLLILVGITALWIILILRLDLDYCFFDSSIVSAVFYSVLVVLLVLIVLRIFYLIDTNSSYILNGLTWIRDWLFS